MHNKRGIDKRIHHSSSI